jgi:hypothetical protein
VKHKVSELEGDLLDAAVALADGGKYEWDRDDYGQRFMAETMLGDHGFYRVPFRPSNDWSAAGPIIERERITLICVDDGLWHATLDMHDEGGSRGPTPLVAAMRAYVASKLGETVELEG